MSGTPIGALVAPVRTWNPTRSPEADFEYVDLGSVDNATKTIVDARHVLGAEAPGRARQLVAAGDVLVSTVRPNLNAVAVVPSELEGATASTGFAVLRPTVDLDSRFLFHSVRSQRFIDEMVRRATGANYPAVTDRVVKEATIWAPALPEQRRIAAILDHVDTQRAKRRQVLARLETLTQSIFNDLFVRESHPIVPLRDLASVKGGKRLPKGAPYATGPTPHPYIRVTDLRDGVIRMDNLRFLTSDVQSQIARYTVDEGDVIISIAGSIGLTAAVPSVLAGANLTENAAKIVANETSAYNGSWLARVLQTRSLQDQIAGKVGQVTIGKLALFRIEQLQIPLPPLALQEEFVERTAKVDSLRTTALRSAVADDELLTSLQSRAFRGEL